MKTQRTGAGHRRARVLRLVVAGALGWAGAGCEHWFGFVSPPPPPPPADSLVLRGDTLAEQAPPKPGTPEAKLAGAHELFRRGEYSKAADLFHSVAEKSKTPEPIALEATFYEAECFRLEGRYPKAADTYTKLLNLSPSCPYNEQAVQHLFEIANFWLDDTRAAMKEAREAREGKRWFTSPHWFHIDKSKPFADEEGRALEKLERVHYTDIKGTLGLGDKALFLCGSVKFFNEDYREADHYFTQLHEHYPDSPYAPQAVELGIISKHMSTGGPDYDGRKVAEARLLVDSALRNYPELAQKKAEFFNKQLFSCAMQQAAKDYNTGEFYRRTGHPGSAWFYYDLVRLRYPNTPYFDLATKRMHELKDRVEKEKGPGALPPIGEPGSRAPGDQPTEGRAEAPVPRPAPPPEAPPPRPLPPGLGR